MGDETHRGGDVHVIKEYVHMILTRVHVIKTHVHVMCHVISESVAFQRRFNCTVKMGGLSKQVPTVDCCWKVLCILCALYFRQVCAIYI